MCVIFRYAEALWIRSVIGSNKIFEEWESINYCRKKPTDKILDSSKAVERCNVIDIGRKRNIDSKESWESV